MINSVANIKAGGQGTAECVASDSGSRDMTWNDVLAAVSWYRENREVLATQTMIDLATCFFAQHGEDAAFIAAVNLVEYHTHRVGREESQASLAFMKVFPDQAHDWYDYDRASREPVIEGVAKNCRCLPRHCKTCPASAAAAAAAGR